MPAEPGLRATVSGSFHLALDEIQAAVAELTSLGVRVLSPADPRVVDEFGDFLYVASDRLRSIWAVQNRHFAAIQASDFVWLAAPDGYVGRSASMEIGAAYMCGTPVYCATPPLDQWQRRFVHIVPSMRAAVEQTISAGDASPDVLLDPVSAVEVAHRRLDEMQRRLWSPSTPSDPDDSVRVLAGNIRSMLRHL